MNSVSSRETLKKRYQKPTLRVYGDVQTLTAAVGTISAQMDGGTGGLNKTH
jgi:hypothetical protein